MSESIATLPASSSAKASPPRLVVFRPRPWTLRVDPVIALQWTIVLLVISQLGQIPFLSTGDREAPLVFNEIFLAGLFVIGGMAVIARRAFHIDSVAVVAIVFAILGGVTTIYTAQREAFKTTELVTSLAYLARWLYYFAIYLYVINLVQPRDVRGVWRSIETMLVLFAAFGLFQSVFLPDFAFMLYPDARPFVDFDPQGHRLVSTILEPNVAGMIIAMGLLVHVAFASVGEPVPQWRTLLFFGALMATFSRSALLAFGFGVVTILSLRGMTKKMMRITGSVVVLIVLFLPQLIAASKLYGKFEVGENSSAMHRYTSWIRAGTIWLDHPWFGIGFNAYAPIVNRTTLVEAAGAGRASSDGGLLFIGTMTGIVGLTVYVCMLLLIALRSRTIWRNERATPEQKGIALAAVAITVAVIVHSIFVNSILATFTMEMMWIIWGLTFVIARGLRTR
jgi:O-antigen ligase